MKNRNRTTVSGCSSTGCGPAECGKRISATTCGRRRWYHEDIPGRWEEFGRRYTAELRQSPAVAEFVRQIAGNDTVTLVYASRNALQNHALILQDYLVKIMSVMTV